MTQWGLDTLFNPAKRHMDEEKRRLQSTREEIGDSSGGKRIDFEAGKVVIERPGGEAADTTDVEDESGTPAVDESTEPAASSTGARRARSASGSRTAAERSAERHRRLRAAKSKASAEPDSGTGSGADSEPESVEQPTD